MARRVGLILVDNRFLRQLSQKQTDSLGTSAKIIGYTKYDEERNYVYLFTCSTSMGKCLLVARNANGLIFMWDVILAPQRLVAMPAAKMLQMPMRIFSLSVFRGKDKLLKQEWLNTIK